MRNGIFWIVASLPLFAASPNALGRERETRDELLDVIENNIQTIRLLTAEQDKDRDQDPGIIESRNFSVMSLDPRLPSRTVLAQAEAMRRAFALRWLGEELPEGAEFAFIHVAYSDRLDEGLTLLCNRLEQGNHRIWLTAGGERALRSTLAHEIAHVALHSRFPEGMPAWANEGIASLYDDQERKVHRDRIVAAWARNRQWPDVRSTLAQEHFHPSDDVSYAIGASLTEFFLTRGDRRQLLDFVQACGRRDADDALYRHYSIRGTDELQTQWQAWAAAS